MRTNLLVALLLLAGCNASGGAGGAGGGGMGGAGGAGGGGDPGGGGGIGGGGGSGGDGGLALGGFGGFVPIPVRQLPNLESITFYETTGAVNAYTFSTQGPELAARIDDALFGQTYDILGTAVEYYDVYYSDSQGVADIDGSYLTISGKFEVALPAGGGLNLAEMSLNYAGGSVEYGNYVASSVALGDNAVPGSVGNCIDGDLATHTTMGNTLGSLERLRITLGFESTSGPPPN